MFNIKFKVFDEDLNEMKVMNLEEFEREFTSIYGNYCMSVEGEGYPYYLPDKLIFSNFEDSQLIDVHLNSLIYVVENLNKYDSFFIKYVENSVTWLLIQKQGNIILLSEIRKLYTVEMNNHLKGGYVITNKEFFNEVELIWGPISINLDEFVDEVINATHILFKVIGEVNQQFQRSCVMNKVFSFVNKTNV
ncbi:hypothetical protein AN1V17_15770 [Vallitalea sediminicola]